MHRRVLKVAVLGFALVGLGLATVPFFGSLKPSIRANSYVAKIDVRAIKPGEFVEVDYYFWRVFALREYDGDFHVFFVPYARGFYWL